MGSISVKELLEAGVHFGHQTRRWNPKMKPYIFGERNGIHIIDLQQTIRLFKKAVDFVTERSAQGKTILFVGTKSQAQETIEEQAQRCGMYFINNRWLGGLLTNFVTVQNSIKRYRKLESMRDGGFYDRVSKKEVARLERERKKLEKNLRGIKEMERCPDAIFLVDSNAETIAVKEATKLGIPIIAIVDTNSDPDLVDYIIPGNDDALRAIQLFAGTVADAVLAGRMRYEAQIEANEREARKRAELEAVRAAKIAADKKKVEAAKDSTRASEAKETKSVESKTDTKSKPEVKNQEMPASKTGIAKEQIKSQNKKASPEKSKKKKLSPKKLKAATKKIQTPKSPVKKKPRKKDR